METSLKCNSCLSFNADCAGMSSNFTGCIHCKDSEKKIFNHYKNRLNTGGRTRFNVIQYLCKFPGIDPYEMAATLIKEGCQVVFDDSSISMTQNEAHERAVKRQAGRYN
jgi:hypothetical protein